MTTKYSTKKALISSMLVLVLCISMLLGTTFAWFTDSVTSANNIIKSGNLDIELEYWDGDSWEDVEGKSDILTNTLWEPGVTEVTYLRVANAGSLALKYQLGINVLSETAGVNVAGESFKLSDYIMFGVVENVNGETGAYANRDDAVAAVTDAKKISAGYSKADSLAANSDSVYLALVVYMPETVENVANHNGETIPEIELGINVLATQFTAESDSFGNDYDANLEPSENGVAQELEDGSTVFYYNEESGFYGRVRLVELPENVGSEYVVPAEVNDLGGALTGATLDKLTIPANLEYGYKSIEGANIGTVVLADGMTTVPNRLFYKANVDNVVIPDSVTALEESAFQQAYVDELVIPASVETFGVHAFAGSTISKITFKGANLTFDNRPMRECANLRTVVFECDDLAFTNTTTNGDCWISNKGANGNNYSNITFYVKNTTVAAKVREAIKHENPATTPIYVGESLFVTAKNVTELNNALSASYNDTLVYLTADIAGDLSFAQNPNGKLVIDGNGQTFDGSINIAAQSNTTAAGAITIENIKFETTKAKHIFISSNETNHYPLNVTVSNCSFEGTGATSEVVGISIKSAMNFVIENCTANNVHSLLQNTSGWNLTISDVEVTNAGRGLALGTVQGVTLTNVKVDAIKYGIRFDASYNNNAVLTDCEVTAFIPVVVRKVTVDSNITFNGTNTMVETNTDGLWCAIGTSEYETNGTLPTEAIKTVTVTLNDTGLSTDGLYNNSGK